jgi:hypothetical protein
MQLTVDERPSPLRRVGAAIPRLGLAIVFLLVGLSKLGAASPVDPALRPHRLGAMVSVPDRGDAGGWRASARAAADGCCGCGVNRLHDGGGRRIAK